MPVDHVKNKATFDRLKPETSGFLEYACPNRSVDSSGWEFRISYYPEHQNLNKAADALIGAFPSIYGDLAFKVLLLNKEGMQDVKQINWDPLYSPLAGRNHRGTECCVYVQYIHQSDDDSTGYELTSAQCKDLMLTAWKALQDADVEGIGYTSASGDRVIRTTFGLTTPFSNAANRPWLAGDDLANFDALKKESYQFLHGDEEVAAKYHTNADDESLLKRVPTNKLPDFQKKMRKPDFLPVYNPLLFQDPLAGIVITFQDLLDYKIDVAAFANMQLARVTETTSHLKAMDTKLIELLKHAKAQSDMLVTQLSQLCSALQDMCGSDEALFQYIKQNKDLIIRCLEKYPRNDLTIGLDPIKSIGNLQEAINMIDHAARAQDCGEALYVIKQAFDQQNSIMLFSNLAAECIKIKNKFLAAMSKDEIKTYCINETTLADWIAHDPFIMQTAFRLFLHAKNEKRLQEIPTQQGLKWFYLAITKLDQNLPGHARLQEQLFLLAQALYQAENIDKSKITILGDATYGMVNKLVTSGLQEEKIQSVNDFKMNTHWQQMLKEKQAVVRDFLDAATRVAVDGSADENGDTPLHHACLEKNGKQLKYLLEAPFLPSLTVQNKQGNNPLHLAYTMTQNDIILIQERDEPDFFTVLSQQPPSKIIPAATQQNNDLETPVLLACKHYADNIEAITTLLKASIPSHCLDLTDKDGYLPFHWACRGGSLEVISLLIKSYPQSCQLIKQDEKALSLIIMHNSEAFLRGFCRAIPTSDLAHIIMPKTANKIAKLFAQRQHEDSSYTLAYPAFAQFLKQETRLYEIFNYFVKKYKEAPKVFNNEHSNANLRMTDFCNLLKPVIGYITTNQDIPEGITIAQVCTHYNSTLDATKLVQQIKKTCSRFHTEERYLTQHRPHFLDLPLEVFQRRWTCLLEDIKQLPSNTPEALVMACLKTALEGVLTRAPEDVPTHGVSLGGPIFS